MTDEADSSVVLAELQVALFRECNNQPLSPWGKPFSCSPDPVTDLSKHLSWSPRQLEQDLLVYYQLRKTSPFFSDATAIATSSRRMGCRSSSWDWL